MADDLTASAESKPQADSGYGDLYEADYSELPSLRRQREAEASGDGLAERARLDFVNSYCRGTVFGASRLAAMARVVTSPADQLTDSEKAIRKPWTEEYHGIVADLDRYDKLRPWGTTFEGAAALGGSLAGGMLSPESYAAAPARGATWLTRTIKAAVQQGGIQAAVDPIVQWLGHKAGTEQGDYDWTRTAKAAGFGAIVGGGLSVPKPRAQPTKCQRST